MTLYIYLIVFVHFTFVFEDLIADQMLAFIGFLPLKTEEERKMRASCSKTDYYSLSI